MFFNLNRAQCYLNLFECFWICLCFLTVVSLHTMPLRAIPQGVRFQPHCSNNLFTIKKHKKWKRMFNMFFNSSTKHSTASTCSNAFELFCVFWMLFCCIWCRCVQSHRMYEFNQIIQIVFTQHKTTQNKWKVSFFLFFGCCSVAYDAVACNLTARTSSTTLFKLVT